MNACARGVFPLLPLLWPAWAQTGGTFRNPLFQSQDPYVVFHEGRYYYSDSDGDRIRIRESATLSGLAHAPAHIVWTAPRRGWDGHANVWAPELHYLDGRWHLYFAADYNTDGRHLLYVLEGGPDPFGPYTPGRTGSPEGQVTESTGKWAIDPNVFTGPDGRLYIAWSCTDDEIGKRPQAICIARMADPLHVGSSTVRIANPVEQWETRGGAIAEGPVGYVREGRTYITYSASASWTPNDYAAGLLVNASGDLLDPAAWTKRGPILDRHGKAYGPGSVILAPSPDGTETWGLYHGYDRLDCPQWACRSIRMQKVRWNADGTPLFGYPVDPQVPVSLPSGDGGDASGWGDSRLGSRALGAWRASASGEVRVGSGGAVFRGDVDSFSYAVSAEVRETSGSGGGDYGLYPLYYDRANYVEAALQPGAGRFVTRAVVGGVARPERAAALPRGFDRSAPHRIRVEKTAARQFLFSLDGVAILTRSEALDFGQVGVFARETTAELRGVAVEDTSHGWGNGFGDAAQGFERGVNPPRGDGYVQGLWTISSGGEAASAGGGPGWHTLYQGNPNRGQYRVAVEARWIGRDGDAAPRYGLIVCHDDRDNQASLWVDVERRALEVNTVVAGASEWRSLPLPSGFDPADFHRLGAEKRGALFVFFLDGVETLRVEAALANGTSGVATEAARASFRNFSVE